MKAAETEPSEGRVLLIDKPLRWTSFDTIRKIRNILGVRKVGHAGTLDPLATGLLIVCTGPKTKEISVFQNLPKEYTGTLTLGEIRPSVDHETEISESRDISYITEEKLYYIASLFKGEIDQVPPMHSAVKTKGKRAYKLARKGEIFELEPRKVTLYEFEITGIRFPEVDFRLVTSRGFYVRSLVRDFGQQLGCGASLRALRRTRIGNYSVDAAINLSELSAPVKE